MARAGTESERSGAGPHPPEGSACPSALPWEPIVGALAGLAAAWVAAGATGLLAHPLRHAITWVFLGAAIVAGWSGRRWSLTTIPVLVVAAVAAVAMTASRLPAVNVMAAAVVLAALGLGRDGVGRSVFLVASLAAAVLGIFVLARTSIPTLWLAADLLGRGMGRCAQYVTGQPLWVGATFGGLDFLVVMAVFYAGWLVWTAPPRWPRAIYAGLAILAGHLLYLIVLAFAPKLLAALSSVPPPPADAISAPGVEPPWSWAAGVRTLVPWNLPAVAGLIHLVIAGVMLRWAAWPAGPPKAAAAAPTPARRWVCWVVLGAAVVVAALLPVVTTLSPKPCSLEGKKVVAYEHGFLNWEKPKHGDYGRLSIGMYGMLQTYVESLGGEWKEKSSKLSEKDLADADVLILLYPNEPWTDGQRDRIEQFVREGGSLLVMGEHTVRERKRDYLKRFGLSEEKKKLWTRPPRGGSWFNDVLQPTAMQVRFDSATFAVGGWLQSYEALAHPTTAGIADDRNLFGVVIGASVRTHLGARPILVGRWGWADPGDEGGSAMMGNHRYDGGEKLGDLVLAAEQPLGKGTVITFGDTSSLTNGITIGAHLFTSRLLGYLASRPSTPQAVWRQVIGLLCAAGLVALLAFRPDPWRVGAAVAALAVSLVICTYVSYRAAEVLPDGGDKRPNNLAYIDSTHMEASSEESWRPDGTMGLAMTLMRDGYLVLDLPELTRRRLEGAGLLVSIAPSREFSANERQIIREWVNDGGIFICTVGYDEREGSRALLADFGFTVGVPGGLGGQAAEPQAMGHFKSPYLRVGNAVAYVRFHAPWAVGCTAPEAKVLVRGRGNLPVIIIRPFGKGKVAVIGDTGFAMNKNLERIGGQPFEGLRENAEFWRSLLTVLWDEKMRTEKMWIPPRLITTQPATRPRGVTP